jgi:hypothetical protein
MLLRFGAGDNFWDGLLQRARQLHLTSPCYWGVRYARQFLRTPIPDDACNELEKWRPPGPVVAAFDRLVSRASLPGSPTASTWPRKLAILALSYYPPPRLRAIATRLFWRKRLPWRTPTAPPLPTTTTTAATPPG